MSMTNKWYLVSRQHVVEGDKSTPAIRETHEMKLGQGTLVRETLYASEFSAVPAVAITFIPEGI